MDISRLWKLRKPSVNGFSLDDFIAFLGIESITDIKLENIGNFPGVVRNRLVLGDVKEFPVEQNRFYVEWRFNGRSVGGYGFDEEEAAISGLLTYWQYYQPS